MSLNTRRSRLRQLSTSSEEEVPQSANSDKISTATVSSTSTATSDLSDVLKDFVTAIKQQVSAPNGVVNTSADNEHIPIFDPENTHISAKQWVRAVDDTGNMHRWTEEYKVYMGAPKLRGLAKIWYEGISATKIITWQELKVKLPLAFPFQQNHAELLTQMMNRKKQANENYTRYFYEKQALLEKCGITGERALSCIISGIDNPMVRIGAKAAAGSSHEPGTLLPFLQECETEAVVNGQTHRRSSNGNKIVSRPYKRTWDQTNTNRHREAPRQPFKCFECGQTGHIRPNCPRLRRKSEKVPPKKIL